LEKTDQKTALKEIEEMKRQIRIKSSARLFCCVHDGDKNYVYGMDNQERILDSYLEKVKEIIRTHELGEDIYLNFRKEAAQVIYDAAIQRNELEWAQHFENKYGLKTDKSVFSDVIAE
jgi:hypothetical protein